MIAHTSLPTHGGVAFAACSRADRKPSLLDALGEPAMLLDARAMVLDANAAASAILASRQGLACRGGRLQTQAGCDMTAIEAAIAELACLPEALSPIRQVSLSPRSGHLPIMLAFVRWRGPVDAVLAIIQAGRAECVGVSSRFGFTAMEAALASDLLTGARLKDIAARRGRQISTLRTQLAHLMAKTGTKRQAELITLLMRTELAQPIARPSPRMGAHRLEGDGLFHLNDNEAERPRDAPKRARMRLGRGG
jgi:DNA-binding CsgD family transcriptional regulator